MRSEKLIQQACKLLAKREHSRKELQTKLAKKCPQPELMEQLLDELSAKGLQSDQRFTERFVQQKISKGNGPLKSAKH